MKALSIRQPWAWLIAHGHKPVENRSWPTSHRGDTLIHAAQAFDFEGLQWVKAMFPELRDKLPLSYELGGVVGIGQVVACVDRSASPWFFGPYGHVFHGARPLPLVKVRGQLSYFDIEITEQLHQALHATTPAQAAAAGQEGLF